MGAEGGAKEPSRRARSRIRSARAWRVRRTLEQRASMVMLTGEWARGRPFEIDPGYDRRANSRLLQSKNSHREPLLQSPNAQRVSTVTEGSRMLVNPRYEGERHSRSKCKADSPSASGADATASAAAGFLHATSPTQKIAPPPPRVSVGVTRTSHPHGDGVKTAQGRAAWPDRTQGGAHHGS